MGGRIEREGSGRREGRKGVEGEMGRGVGREG